MAWLIIKKTLLQVTSRMASKFALHSTNFKFTSPSKFAGIPIFIVVYIVVLTKFTTCTSDYALEKQPTESIQSKPDPVLLSLDISLAELQNVSSLAQQKLIADSKNLQTLEALRNRTFLFEVSKSHLEDSMSLLTTVGQGDKVLAAPEILALDLMISQ